MDVTIEGRVSRANSKADTPLQMIESFIPLCDSMCRRRSWRLSNCKGCEEIKRIKATSRTLIADEMPTIYKDTRTY